VVAAGDDLQALLVAAVADAVDDAMVTGDPARPSAGEIAAQQLGLRNTGERVAADILEYGVDRRRTSRSLARRSR
jgi:hypothetical protein